MSYDLHFFRVPPGADPDDAGDASFDAHQDEIAPGPLDPEKERTKRALADALTAHDPALALFPIDHAEIAREEGITLDEARRRWRDLELGDEESGIQIVLADDFASLAVPFWHEGPAAEAVWTRIGGYLRVLEREGGLRAYDPQLGRVLRPEADGAEFAAAYGRGVEVLRRVVAEESAPRRPWWKFW